MPNGEMKFPRPYNQSFWLCEFGESAVGYDPNGDFEDYDYEEDISLNINDQDSNFFKNSWYEIVTQSLAKVQLSNNH